MSEFDLLGDLCFSISTCALVYKRLKIKKKYVILFTQN